ncbi:UPF0158 family protein [Parabacteroides sp. FAFU027]|uniref:UPF0158 family protein n=1 Tax=Parabacteroides sp. FAFU027 TaxID=2922715 RepID=UPI001FB04654|nr:UPF0158 family protein [Parabacteroides sp. FAFU027]
MNSNNQLDEILRIIHAVKDDKRELQKILEFLQEYVIIEEPDDDEFTLPTQYDKIIKSIAGSIDAGLVCFLNPETLEIEEIPQCLIDDPEEAEMQTGLSINELELKYPEWEKRVCIEPLESYESFKIMEKFVQTLSNEKLRNKLSDALQSKKPFAKFKQIIDNSPYRQDWFDFKNNWLQRYVKYIVMG